jgi:hypothetical protein
VRPDGDARFRGGVRPDVEVWPEPGEPGDPVLDAAVRALLGPAPAVLSSP